MTNLNVCNISVAIACQFLTRVMQVHHGGAGTTAASLKAAVIFLSINQCLQSFK